MSRIQALYILLFLPLFVFAQSSAITSAGDNVKTETRIVNWSIGNVVTNISNSENYTVYAGAPINVYQIRYDESSKIKIKCYPNPITGGILNIQLYTNDTEGLHWSIYSIEGQTIKNGSVESKNITIDAKSFNRPIYILNIFDRENKLIATAKLLKK